MFMAKGFDPKANLIHKTKISKAGIIILNKIADPKKLIYKIF